MVEIEFNYEQNITIIQGNINDSYEKIVEKFINKTNLDINNIYFLCNGIYLNNNETFQHIMNSQNFNNKIAILVLPINKSTILGNNNISKSNDIICPQCKEICKYDIKDYKIKLYDCKNGHITENIKLTDFDITQNIDLSQIKCDKCKIKNIANTYGKEFYICLDCKMNLCVLCKSIHDKEHNIIYYDNKNFICNQDNKPFIKYCENCKTDICLSCANKHKDHNVLSYKQKAFDVNDLRKKMDVLNNDINKFKDNLNVIITKLKKIMDNMDAYYNINKSILNIYEKSNNLNYYLLINLKNINDSIDKEIENIRFNYDYGNNLNRMLYLYSEMMNENVDIEIKYQLNNLTQANQMLLNRHFINNNIYKCKIIYKNVEYDLKENLSEYGFDYSNKNTLTIKIKGINNVTDVSCMFKNCMILSSLSDISKWNISNVTNMCRLFNKCSSLISLPDLSLWDISNVIDISHMFSWCSRLTSIPNISKWDTSKVISFDALFNECNSIKSLPDISKWNTSNVTKMNSMFYDCISLISLPDISLWDTSNVFNMNNMFRGCSSLKTLPDISKWNISNVSTMNNMFSGCSKSLIIPLKFK